MLAVFKELFFKAKLDISLDVCFFRYMNGSSLNVVYLTSRVMLLPFPKATDAAISRCKGDFDDPSERSERMGQELSSIDASGPLASVRLFLDAWKILDKEREKMAPQKLWGLQRFHF